MTETSNSAPPRKGMAWLLAGVIVMAIVSPLLFWWGFHTLDPFVNSRLTTNPAQNELEITLPAQGFAILTPQKGSTASVDALECAVTDPHGHSVPIARNARREEAPSNMLANAKAFTAKEPGTYQASCNHPVHPHSGKNREAVMAGLAGTLGEGLKRATLLGIIGLIIMAVGIKKLFRSRDERRQWESQIH